jgi:hypothetical protein
LNLSDFDAIYAFYEYRRETLIRDSIVTETIPLSSDFFKSRRLKEVSQSLRFLAPEHQMCLERFYAASSQYFLTILEYHTSKVLHKGGRFIVIFVLAALYEELQKDMLEPKISKKMASHLMQAILSRLQFFCARYFSHGHRRLRQPQKTPNDDEEVQRQLGAWVFQVTEQSPVLPVHYARDPNFGAFTAISSSPCFFCQIHQKTLSRLLPRDEVQQNLVTGDHDKRSRLLARMMSSATLKFYGHDCESLTNEIMNSYVDTMVGEHRIEVQTGYRTLTKLAFDGSLLPDIGHAERLCLLAYTFYTLQHPFLLFLGKLANLPDDPRSQEHIHHCGFALRKLFLHILLTTSLEVLAAFVISKKQQIAENHEESRKALVDWLNNDPDREYLELVRHCAGQVRAACNLVYQDLPTYTMPSTI